MSETATILVVDDEDMVVSSIRVFLELETDYQVVTFTSATKALVWAREHPVDLVISDYLMPEMDGLAFLSGLREVHPEAPRIILTGYADKANAIRAINEIGLYQYIEKPWNNDDLRIILRNGLERRNLMERLRQKVVEINKAYADLQGIQQEVLKAFV